MVSIWSMFRLELRMDSQIRAPQGKLPKRGVSTIDSRTDFLIDLISRVFAMGVLSK